MSKKKSEQENEPISDRFSALCAKYAEELPSLLGQLSELAEKAKQFPDNPEHLAQARLCAHTIKGTAGSYGFAEIGEQCRLIEDGLSELENGKPSWSQTEQAVERALALARKLPKPKTIESQTNNQSIKQAPINQGAIARVLVVDDDPSMLSYIEEIGRQRLIEVIPAEGSRQALEKATEYQLDAAILDIHIGATETSFKLAKQLRELPAHQSLPLAFISANPHVQNRVAAVHAGASLFLNKPLDPDSFESAVHQLVALRQSTDPKILVCDDDTDFCQIVTAVLEHEGMKVHTTSDPMRILETLHETSPDLLLLDVNMPNINGFEVCRMLRTISRWQDLPVIFLTANTDLETRVEAFKSGGDDYLPKPFVPLELVSRVRLRAERAQLLEERADKDPTTGLWLRRPFMERLKAMLATARRMELPVTVGILDIDYFKSVNDTHGHLAGDAVLAGFGKLLQQRFRVEDLRGRWGGDEFIVAFQKAPLDDMHQAVAKFINEFSQIEFIGEDGKQFHATLTVGLTAFPENGANVHDLIASADRHLYLAKQAGRNRVVSEDG